MYMAPEQFNGSHLDEKVDVYALGCILNECLTGRQPWTSSPNFFQVGPSTPSAELLAIEVEDSFSCTPHGVISKLAVRTIG